ncbi:MAG: Fic/DOC family protein [Polaribacter sp.]
MSNSYKYLDSNYTYVNPKSGILKNLVGITDADDLLFFESVTVTKRISELYTKPIKIIGIESLFLIHKQLFQDIYAWAGKERLVEISKDGKQFFPTSNFTTGFRYIDELILDFKKTENNDKDKIAENLAQILDNINYLHPFRDGNGRVQREFIRMLALEKGIQLNLNPADNKSVYEKYMEGTINSDTKLLKELILNLIE